MTGTGIRARNEAICEQYLSGDLYPEIAEKFGISKERVRQILNNKGVEIRPRCESVRISIKKGRFAKAALPTGPQDAARETRVVRLVGDGMSYRQAAKELGISRSAVAGIVRRYKKRMAA
ncbi:MAG: helix-turn-helix domain-containing protein [Pseudomonadota bacterium]